MSRETKKSGSAAITCDCLTCHAEVLAMTPEDAETEAKSDGWSFRPDGSHLCPDCLVGRCPGEAAAIGRFGATSLEIVVAHRVLEGDEIRGHDGRLLGRIARTAEAGQPSEIDFVVPLEGKQSGSSCMVGRVRNQDDPILGDCFRECDRHSDNGIVN